MKTKQLLLLLPVFAVCASPAYANYFANPSVGMTLNTGSAPNPKPALRQVFSTSETTRTTMAPAAPAPKLVAEVVPPPPAQPAEARHFIVFFDFDKFNLTTEARQVVAAAVSEALKSGLVRVVVTGHTDTVGSSNYNQALSERRAAAVKSEMVHLGMTDGGIATVGKSFTDPLIATGPGVREPQNRRAVIDLNNLPVAELN